MSKNAIFSEKLPPAAGPFSPAAGFGGIFYLSGQIGQDPVSGRLVPGGIEPETEQIFRNLAALLEAAGRTFSDVLRIGLYLTDLSAFTLVNGIYARHFDKPYPARTTIGVAALPLGAAIELDAIVAGGRS
jgi:2-iminobutanoate/2-iminopropanoate deaminase